MILLLEFTTNETYKASKRQKESVMTNLVALVTVAKAVASSANAAKETAVNW